jgi:hypothetical protein
VHENKSKNKKEVIQHEGSKYFHPRDSGCEYARQQSWIKPNAFVRVGGAISQ